MRTSCTVLLVSLFLSCQQRVSSTAVEKKSTNLSRNNPIPANEKEKHSNAGGGGNLDSCLTRQGEGEGEAAQMSALAEMDDQATTASKADADDNTAPTSVTGLDEEEEEEDSRNSSGGEGHIPERYIVGCGGDRVEAARR